MNIIRIFVFRPGQPQVRINQGVVCGSGLSREDAFSPHRGPFRALASYAVLFDRSRGCQSQLMLCTGLITEESRKVSLASSARSGQMNPC